MAAMGMSNRSTWCSLTRCRMRSSGPSKGGSPRRSGGSRTRNASAAARATASAWPASASWDADGPAWVCFCLAIPEGSLPRRLPQRELHGRPDLLHGPLRDRAGLLRPELHQVVDVLGAGQQRLAALADLLLHRQEPLQELLLAVHAADPGGAAVLIHP